MTRRRLAPGARSDKGIYDVLWYNNGEDGTHRSFVRSLSICGVIVEEHIAVDESPKATWGQTLLFRPRLGGRWWSLSPMWAAFAGALSSSTVWTYADLLHVLTVVILAEAVYQAIIAAIGWKREIPAPAQEHGELREWFPWLPYSAPGTPSGRLARTWANLQSAWRANRWTGQDGVLAQMAVNLLVAGVLSAYLGWPAVWALIAAVALGIIHHLLGPAQARVGRWVLAVAAIFLPWILAGALLGVMSRASIVVALLFAVGRGALLDRGRLVGDLWAWILADGCQLIIVGILIVLKQPVAAGVMVVFVAAQVLLQAGPRSAPLSRRLARVQPLVVLSMLLAGWALHV